MLDDLRRAPPEDCITDLELDEWRAGELSASAAAQLEQHASECARCRARHTQWEAEATSFLERFPRFEPPAKRETSEFTGLPERDEAATRIRRRSWALSSAGVALAVAASFLFLLRPASFERETELKVRSKGGASIGFFVKRGARVLTGADGQVVHPGDRLRFTLSTPAPQHVAILSLDGMGVASVYYPSGPRSQRVGGVRDHALNSSVELDGALGEERIWGVFCAAPFSVEPLRQRLAQTGELKAPAGCTTDLVRLKKEAGP